MAKREPLSFITYITDNRYKSSLGTQGRTEAVLYDLFFVVGGGTQKVKHERQTQKSRANVGKGLCQLDSRKTEEVVENAEQRDKDGARAKNGKE